MTDTNGIDRQLARRSTFILGGNDAEMKTIQQLLDREDIRWVQPNKGWGDHRYTPSDVECGRKGPFVFVEAVPGDGWSGFVAVIDHHADRSGEPASVLQVIDLLGLELDSEQARLAELVAANDTGWIPGMIEAGATPEEIGRVRSMDRSAQGITPEKEAEAERALAEAEERLGDIRVVRMAHSKTATVIDRLAVEALADGRPIPAVLILSGDGEVNLVGSADGALCQELKDSFPGSWAGGSGLGQAGGVAYWGGYPDHRGVLDFIRSHLG